MEKGNTQRVWIVEQEARGMLVDPMGSTEVLSEVESRMLRDVVTAIRRGGWFPEWLACQVASIGDETNGPIEHYPSPAQIAGTLTLVAAEWEDALNDAREMASRRPDLIAEMLPRDTAAQPETTRVMSA